MKRRWFVTDELIHWKMVCALGNQYFPLFLFPWMQNVVKWSPEPYGWWTEPQLYKMALQSRTKGEG